MGTPELMDNSQTQAHLCSRLTVEMEPKCDLNQCLFSKKTLGNMDIYSNPETGYDDYPRWNETVECIQMLSFMANLGYQATKT